MFDSYRVADSLVNSRPMPPHARPHLPVAAVLLAAGASTRLGSPKQLLQDANGVALAARAATQLLDAGCCPVVVVTGATYGPVSDALAGLTVTIVHNADFRDGMASSIRRGIGAMRTLVSNGGGVLIAACDMPAVETEHYRDLIRASDSGKLRTGTMYMSVKCSDTGLLLVGIPAIFTRNDTDALVNLVGDKGAKSLLALSDTRSVRSAGSSFDLDTPDDVRAWRATFLERKTPGQSP